MATTNAPETSRPRRRTGPTIGEEIRYRSHLALPALGAPVSWLAAAGVFAVCQWGLVRHVRRLEAAVTVANDDPGRWLAAARTRAYDRCYFGCGGDGSGGESGDPACAERACALTAALRVPGGGVDCDAARMWNWRARYPPECLRALAETYFAEWRDGEVARKQRHYRDLYALSILTLIAGVVAGFLVYAFWLCCTEGMRWKGQQERERRDNEMPPPVVYDAGVVAEARPSPTSNGNKNNKSGGAGRPRRARRHDGAGRRRMLLLPGFLAGLFGRGAAWPGLDRRVWAYFADAEGAVYGEVYGFLGNWYSYSCNCGSEGCSTCYATDPSPGALVNATLAEVRACGFEVRDLVPADVNMRVANPLIEKNWWVSVKVNAFNATVANRTDDGVTCLWEIGNKPGPSKERSAGSSVSTSWSTWRAVGVACVLAFALLV